MLHLRATTVREELHRLLRMPPSALAEFVKFNVLRYMIAVFGKSHFIQKIVLVDGWIQDTIITSENIMCEFLLKKTMESLGEKRLKIE